MSNQRIYRLAIVLVAVALLGLACGACASTPEPTPLPTVQPTVLATQTPTAEPTVPPTEEASPSPETPTEESVVKPTEEPTPCPEVNCLPDCYADNRAPAGGDGTKGSPWHGTAVDRQLTEAIECAAQERGIIPSYLTVSTCSTSRQDCSRVLYTYDGQWISTQLEPVTPVPEVGVPLPFVLVLVFLAVLGIVLLGTGIFLRLRARTLRF